MGTTSPTCDALSLGAVALVGIGGACGTLARYLLGAALPFVESVSVLAINVAGSLLLGFIVALFAGSKPRLRLLLGTGFCGGFTTYSALAVGVAELARAGSAGGAAALAVCTVVAAGLATIAGLWVGNACAAHAPGGRTTQSGNASPSGDAL